MGIKDQTVKELLTNISIYRINSRDALPPDNTFLKKKHAKNKLNTLVSLEGHKILTELEPIPFKIRKKPYDLTVNDVVRSVLENDLQLKPTPQLSIGQ